MTQSQKFKIGDLVQLKSGGPKMTIVDLMFPDNPRCSWFVGGKANQSSFAAQALIPVTDDATQKEK